MHIEYKRLTGQVCANPRSLNEKDMEPFELKKLAKKELLDFYEHDGTHFWPRRPLYPNGNPEMVQIVNDDGNILVRYSIGDVKGDLNLWLCDSRPDPSV